MIEKMISKSIKFNGLKYQKKKKMLTNCTISGFLTSATVPPPSYVPNAVVSPIRNVNGPIYNQYSIK